MKITFRLEPNSIIPLYQQIKDAITEAIVAKKLKIGDKIPSVNQISKEFSLAPGTVAKAYEDLRANGIIASRQGKGFYIASTNTGNQLKVFLLFDRLNAYKEILLNSLMENMGPQVEFDIYFHQYNLKRFRQLIHDNLGNYNFYIIMPHFNEDVSDILAEIPSEKLAVIDKEAENLKTDHISVTQNFAEDIFISMHTAKNLLLKYSDLNLVLAKNNKFQFVPEGIVKGFKKFCAQNSIKHNVIDSLKPELIKQSKAFIVFTDADLILLIKEAQKNNMVIGQDLGIVSYDDTPVKEVIAGGVSTFSTDFEKMGKKIAELVLNGTKEKIYNPFYFVKRNSL